MISFVQIGFTEAMGMIEAGKINCLYFMSGNQVLPAISYDTSYYGIEKVVYLKKVVQEGEE